MSQKFNVTGMSCGHCVSTVQNAVQAVDPEAQVTVDLETGTSTAALSMSR
jgi:copper chaperone